MNLKYFIDQLEAELVAQNREAQLQEAAELAEGEIASITLMQRLCAALGKEITIRAGNGHLRVGNLQQVGNGWILLHTQTGEELINLKNCTTITGLAGSTVMVGNLVMRSPMAQVLRRLARARKKVAVTLHNDTTQNGYLTAVYKDHLELIAESATQVRVAIMLDTIFAVRPET